MARVNQGIYKRYIAEKDESIRNWKGLKSRYWDETDNFRGDCEDIQDFILETNDLYVSSKELIQKIEDLLDTQKFEDEKIVEKYRGYIGELKNSIDEMKEYATKGRELSGTDLTPLEERSFRGLAVLM